MQAITAPLKLRPYGALQICLCHDLGKTTTWLVNKRRLDNIRVLYIISKPQQTTQLRITATATTLAYIALKVAAIAYSKQHMARPAKRLGNRSVF